MASKEQVVIKNDPKSQTKIESKIEKNSKISICDFAKNNTSEVLQKMEYQVPIYLQGYTDLFTKYLHFYNASFGTCRISEKQFFDKLGIDHTILEEYAEYWNYIKNLTIIQIETYSKFVQDYIDFRISTIDSLDKSISSALDYYSMAISILKK